MNGLLASGVAVITSRDALGRPVGSTVDAICSLSLNPPLLLVALPPTSRTLHAVQTHGAFGVNVLREEQSELAERFTLPGAEGEEADYTVGAADVPLLSGALAAIECRLYGTFPGQERDLVVGVLGVSRFGAPAEPSLLARPVGAT